MGNNTGKWALFLQGKMSKTSCVHVCLPGMDGKAVLTASQFIFKLQRCRQRKDVELARCLYFHICENALETSKDLCNYIVSTFVDCRSMPDALHVFDELAHSNEFSWTSLIQGWTECGYPENSLIVFKRMQEAFIHPSKHTFVAALKACSQLKWVEQGQDIHTTIVQKGYEEDSFVGNTMVDMYAKLGKLGEARQVFEQLETQNVVSWNALITGYIEHGYDIDALRCLEEMESQGLSPDHVTLAGSVKACNSLGDVDKGKEVHTKVMLKGVERAPSVSTTLVDMYAKCGLMMDARVVLDQVSDQTVASWTALITGYTEQGFGEDSLKCIEQMQLQGIPPDDATFVCSLKACICMASVEKGQELHTEIVAKGMEKNSFVSNTLVDMYVKCGCLVEARHTFDQLQFRTVISWNVLVTGYIEHASNEEALECLKRMQLTGMLPDVSTFSCSLKACANLQAIEQGCELHTRICKEGLEKATFVANTLIDMYARCGSIAEAQKVFDQLPIQNLVSWNTLITGYIEHELGAEALKCLEEMQANGIRPDTATFICCLKASADLKLIEKGFVMHIDIVKEGLETEPFVGNGLIDVYSKCGYFAEAQHLFEQLPVRNVVSWSTLIAGFTECGCCEHALDCLKQMQAEGVSPNTITFLCSLKACGSIGAIDTGREIHAKVMNQSFEKGMSYFSTSEPSNVSQIRMARLEVDDVPLANALIDMYCKCGSTIDAEKLFDMLPIMDIVSWNALIAGYARQGESKSVFRVFDRIKEQGAQPNGITFLSILTVCSHAGLVNMGQKYFKAMDKKHHVAPAIVHYNCMLDLLGRAGRFKEAVLLLKKMPLNPNVDTWCTLLGACSKWGNVELGRHAFEYAMKLDKSNAAAFIVMSNMYAEAQMWEELRNIQAILQVSKDLCDHLEIGSTSKKLVNDEVHVDTRCLEVFLGNHDLLAQKLLSNL